MPNPVLRSGSRGPFVEELQRHLNARLTPSPGLRLDGDFGARTNRAVRQFQRDNWLVEDGIAGNCTWNALRQTEAYTILHRVNMVAQPTGTTCWAASTAMVLGQHTPVTAPPFMLNASGALLNDSELNDARISSQFCQRFGLILHYPQSWLPAGLAGVMRRGSVMCNLLWNVQDYGRGAGSDSHWVVFAGIRGDGTANGTTLRVYDPLPVGRGNMLSINYGRLLKAVPAATYQLFQR